MSVERPETEPEYRKNGEIMSERIQNAAGRLAVRCAAVVFGLYGASVGVEALAAQEGVDRNIHFGVAAFYGVLTLLAWHRAKAIGTETI